MMRFWGFPVFKQTHVCAIIDSNHLHSCCSFLPLLGCSSLLPLFLIFLRVTAAASCMTHFYVGWANVHIHTNTSMYLYKSMYKYTHICIIVHIYNFIYISTYVNKETCLSSSNLSWLPPHRLPPCSVTKKMPGLPGLESGLRPDWTMAEHSTRLIYTPLSKILVSMFIYI